MKKLIYIFPIIVIALVSSCKEAVKFKGEAQGTYYAVTYYDDQNRMLQTQIDSLLSEFDKLASIYQESSLISRLNRNESEAVSDEVFTDIFALSHEVSILTEGAFDITVGPLVNAWGFGFKNKADIDSALIDSLLQYVGYTNIEIVNGQLLKADSNIQIDMNAVAQGYSVDLIGKYLESLGIKDYLVEVGGEVLAKGEKAGGKAWKIGIEKPVEGADSPREIKASVELNNMAVATSGSYRKFYEEDGIKYSHTIDPSNGYPVKHSLLSASVFADNCAYADALATAFMVMGIEKTKAFTEAHPEIEVYLIYSNEEGALESWATKNLSDILMER